MFKAGQRVRIKANADKIKGGLFFNQDMKQYLGEVCIINRKGVRNTYILEALTKNNKDVRTWSWSEKWLIRLAHNKKDILKLNIK